MQETRDKRIWTVLSLLQWGTDYLNEKGIENPRLTIELLLGHALKSKRIDLYTGFDKPISQSELMQFKTLLQRRLTYEPIQYILGETEFMGLSFVVDRRVLVPRPETEVLVEEAITLTQKIGPQLTFSVLDIGTGCGNIAVSLAKFIKNATVTAIDNSREALEVARINIDRHDVENRVRLIVHDIFGPPGELARTPFDLILSNPPYISKEEANTLPPEILQFEPKQAVIEGGDGLSFYRRISESAANLLKKGGWILVEIAYNQDPAVGSIFSSAGFQNIQLIRDYDGNNRVVKAQLGP